MTGAPPLQARGVVASLGGRRVVDDVSLTLHAGQWVALVGPNGAGKSTLLQVLAGLLPAAAGEVALQGRPLAAWPARERAARLAVAVRDLAKTGLERHPVAEAARG